ncbi:hypothetical protein WR25_20136 [Diploscapter pachys]|uniref:MH2 domain-containing protein n=1 Tax=Diploscapter pachys TaxID=2018661 RepID=A0A2A2LRW9_9BILA|nr:hypothetical protein WR25_20136 [Diploscapter pachys]
MVSRAALLDRLLKGLPDEQPTTSKGNPTWTDFEIFQQDNLSEIECKLDKIDNQIWAKIVIMERGTRTAKAYLRNQRVWIDGSLHEFDGVRMGLRNFRNTKRDAATEMSFVLLAKGIELQLDSNGNIWLLNKGERPLVVMSQGIKYTVYKKLEKIFDLKRYKNLLSSGLEGDHLKRHKRDAMLYVQFARSPSLLECPLWICLVHLAALELCHLLSSSPSNPDSGLSTGSGLSPPSVASSHSPANSSVASGRPESLPLHDGPKISPKTALIYSRRATFIDDTYAFPRCPPIPPFPSGELRRANSSYDLTDPQTESLHDNVYSVPQSYVPYSSTSFLSSRSPSSVDKNDYPQKSRGGVKKKINLEREKSAPIYSNIPPSKGNHSYDCAQSSPNSGSTSSVASNFLIPPMRYVPPPRSRSIVDLRTLSALARPAYFKQQQNISHRGGPGHMSTNAAAAPYKSNPALA